MTNAVRLGVLLSLLAVCGRSSADDLAVEEWIEQYGKLGGKAFLSTDKLTLCIQKREGQKPLVSLKGLKPAVIGEVYLQGYQVADEDLEALAGWTKLEQVAVEDGEKITDMGIKSLTALPKLRRLVLSNTAVTGAGLTAFSGHKELVRLDVSNSIGGNKVKNLELKEMPELQSVILTGKGVTLVRLTKMPKLEFVEFPMELEEADISEAGALTELDFRGTHLKKLTMLGLPKLESLDLKKTQIDADAVAVIQKAFPGVKVKK